MPLPSAPGIFSSIADTILSYSSSVRELPPINKAVGMCLSWGGRFFWALVPRLEEGVIEVSPEKSGGSSVRAVGRVREVWTTIRGRGG